MDNPELGQDVKRTFYDHFRYPVEELLEVKYFTEEEDKKTKELSEWVEIRSTGPKVTPYSKYEYGVYHNISILVVVAKSNNLYRVDEIADMIIFHANSISITNKDDLCLFTLRPTNITKKDLGRINGALQAVVDIDYEGESV